MKTQRLELVFPEKLIKKPIIYQLVKDYDVIPNIRRATVDETFGQMIMELSGEEADLEKAFAYLRDIGVEIEYLDSFVE
ncbi:MAG: NIL domain-containing protein [Thermoleophilia bacterium]